MQAQSLLEQEITEAKRELDAAIGKPDDVRTAWSKLSALVKRRSELMDVVTDDTAGN